MPPELEPWVSTAVIVGFMFYFHRRLESRMDRLESRLESCMNRPDSQMGKLRERMAHLAGLLKGLREVITRRNVA